MNDTICYKIQNAYMLPYEKAIDEKAMDYYEKNNEIIASSRIYFICKLRLNGFIIKRLSKPEVLYIGETFDKKNRFSPHKKLLKATTIVKKNEILAVYFLHIRFSYFGLNQFQNNPLDIFNEIKDIYNKTSIRLVERLFIKLFNPVLNDKHNDENVLEDNLVKKKLIDNFIQYVNLDVGMNDNIFNFIGGRRNESQDLYTFDLTNNEMTFGHPLIE
ncbi:MAG: hypothetical protein REI64_18035 [Pedobacter sp.]|uniref:hypothetical protein n=1 Tax=Pedobacter sp. TaxID=1411316 RepID=UPI002808F58E|nr:hypothetical protein [Pedobacter sp.]MDQ8006710.1 hypothetical protein [Pedobacter sp.]